LIFEIESVYGDVTAAAAAAVAAAPFRKKASAAYTQFRQPSAQCLTNERKFRISNIGTFCEHLT